MCDDLNSVLRAHDDVCESLSEAAEICFQKLNSEFYSGNRSRPKLDREARSRTLAELITDYEREIKKLKTKSWKFQKEEVYLKQVCVCVW